jgi:transcriptional regulator EpsA
MFAIDPLTLNQHELERLLINFETSIKVRKRHQLYLWTQGVLQSFLPHETMLCGLGYASDNNLRTEICSRAVIDDAQTKSFCHGEQSLLLQMARHWADGSCAPMTITTSSSHPLAQTLRLSGIDRAACHGMPEFGATSRKQPSAGSFFVFLHMPETALPRYKYLLGLMLPHLHVALMHVCDSEGADVALEKMSEPALSERERQVLQWVRQGKTNHEIGQILSISPLTVKNHVQKILRKLNVSNRAQAAARGGKNDVVKQVKHGSNILDDGTATTQ